jgi:hypothetical protein
MRGRNQLLLIGTGILCALLAGELVMRAIEQDLPRSSPWPTAETEVKYTQLAQIGDQVEVVFLGSSATEAAVDPELFSVLSGRRVVYNAALPFSTPLSNEAWLDEVVLDWASPAVVIIGMPAWPAHTTAENDPLRVGIQEADDLVSDPGVGRSVSLLRNKGVLADWDQRLAREASSGSDLMTSLGHQTGYYHLSNQSLAGRFPPFGAPRMSSENEEAMRRSVDTLTQAGRVVVLMIEPGRYPGEVSKSDTTEYLDSLEDLGRDLRVPVWDTYSERWNPDHFVDEAHFNQEGTVAFTSYLAELIIEMDRG